MVGKQTQIKPPPIKVKKNKGMLHRERPFLHQSEVRQIENTA